MDPIQDLALHSAFISIVTLPSEEFSVFLPLVITAVKKILASLCGVSLNCMYLMVLMVRVMDIFYRNTIQQELL